MVSRDGTQPEVGLTGARFGGASRRQRRRAAVEAATQEMPAVPDSPAVPTVPVVSAPDVPEPPPWPSLAEITAASGRSSLSVRPYVLTGGRTRSDLELAIETLVSAVPGAQAGFGEESDIVALCREPRSVAEVAALLQLPLGVARVLLGDLAAGGLLTVHRTVGPDQALLERVLSGLRRL